MEEIRKNQIAQLKTKSGEQLEGIVFAYSKDRVSILISYESLADARKIKELDELFVKINTHLGVKKMFSHVIDPLNRNNCILIENNAALPVEQKREFVRVLSNHIFEIKKQNNLVAQCYCVNISAGGVAFSTNDTSFAIGEIVDITYSENDFERQIKCSGEIIKKYDDYYVAKHLDLKPFDEDKIVKYVFRLITEK